MQGTRARNRDPAAGCRSSTSFHLPADAAPGRNHETFFVALFAQLDAQGNTIHCTQATDAEGNLRFVDGISVMLNFNTMPVLLPDTLPPRS